MYSEWRVQNDARYPTCPHCRARLSKAPKARVHCRSCGELLVPRTWSIYHTGILSEAQAMASDCVRALAESFDVSQLSSDLVAESGADQSFIGVVLVKGLHRFSEDTEDPGQLALLFRITAWYSAWFGLPFFQLLQAARIAELDYGDAMWLNMMYFTKSQRPWAELIVPYHECAACGVHQNNTLVALDTLRLERPFPHVGCTFTVGSSTGFCPCGYRINIFSWGGPRVDL